MINKNVLYLVFNAIFPFTKSHKTKIAYAWKVKHIWVATSNTKLMPCKLEKENWKILVSKFLRSMFRILKGKFQVQCCMFLHVCATHVIYFVHWLWKRNWEDRKTILTWSLNLFQNIFNHEKRFIIMEFIHLHHNIITA